MLNLNKLIIDSILENADREMCERNIKSTLNVQDINEYPAEHYFKMYIFINGVCNVTALAGDESQYEDVLEDASHIRKLLTEVERNLKLPDHLLFVDWENFKVYSEEELQAVFGDDKSYYFRYYSGILSVLELDIISSGNIIAINNLLGSKASDYILPENIQQATHLKRNIERIINSIKAIRLYNSNTKVKNVLDYNFALLDDLLNTNFHELLVTDTMKFKSKIDNGEVEKVEDNELFEAVYTAVKELKSELELMSEEDEEMPKYLN